MAFDAIHWAMAQDTGSTASKLVLVALADNARGGLAWPSLAALQAATYVSRNSLIRILAKLANAGLIEDTRQRKGATHQVKVWKLAQDQPGLALGPAKGRQKRNPLKAPKGSRMGDSLQPRKGLQNDDPLNEAEGLHKRNHTGFDTVVISGRKGNESDTRNQLEPVKESLLRRNQNAETLAQIFDAWNLMASGHDLPVAKSLTDDRRKKLKARIKDHGAQAQFLLGHNNTGWKASFDFILIPARLNKLIEGAYQQADQASHQGNSGNPPQTMTEIVLAEIRQQRAHHGR
jgi:hypothetical protein